MYIFFSVSIQKYKILKILFESILYFENLRVFESLKEQLNSGLESNSLMLVPEKLMIDDFEVLDHFKDKLQLLQSLYDDCVVLNSMTNLFWF